MRVWTRRWWLSRRSRLDEDLQLEFDGGRWGWMIGRGSKGGSLERLRLVSLNGFVYVGMVVGMEVRLFLEVLHESVAVF